MWNKILTQLFVSKNSFETEHGNVGLLSQNLEAKAGELP